jgi:2-succinyl-6-hydroxy-2,4-cyclohexadiene-1-carboxylate synthase
VHHVIPVEGYQFHVVTLGNPQSSALIFLHGFLGDWRDFAIALTALSQEYYCVAIDLPGHGHTQVLGDDAYYTLEKTVLGLIQIHRQLIGRPCRLVGYSMGGRVGLYLSLQFPQSFDSVILESTSPGLKTEQERQARQHYEHQLVERLKQESLQTFLAQWYDQPLFKTLKKHPQFPEILAQRLRNHPLALAKSLQFLGTGHQPSLWERLSELKLPLFLVVGELDEKFVALNREMARCCARAQLVIIPGCGHSIHWEDSATFIELIRSGRSV